MMMEKSNGNHHQPEKPLRQPKRITPFLVFVTLSSALLIGRLFQIQVLLHNTYSQMAADQQENRVPIELPRGKIFDRRGTVLALDIPRSYSYALRPYQFKNTVSAAKHIARKTGLPYSLVLEKLKSKSSFVYLIRQLDTDKAKKFQNLPQLIELTEVKRFYPYGPATPRIIGFTDPDCRGLAGLELLYDSTLASITGWEIVLADALGNESKGMIAPLIEPLPGSDLILTIDNVIQNIVALELKAAVKQWQAKAAFALVMLPRSGEVLGIHCEPEFNPNNYPAYPTEAQKEKSVLDLYEPGSTFKIIPILTAIRQGISLKEKFFCEYGKYSVAGHRISDVHPYGYLTVEEILIHSSNIGVAKISQRVGKKTLYQSARDLGFGLPTGIEVPGEARGRVLNPAAWDNILLATFGIGQGLSCTGIQLAAAYAAIAADGLLIRPRLLRSKLAPHADPLIFRPQTVRRGMSQDEARTLTSLLVRAVEEGTGKEARIEGVTIAGKTGTAQKYICEEKKYSEDKFIASFIGFSTEEPRILCLVVIDEPKFDIFGGKVAAPCFRNIMRKVIPVVTAEQRSKFGPKERSKHEIVDKISLPNLINLDKNQAQEILHSQDLTVLLTGEGGKITRQYPLPGTYIAPGDTVLLSSEKPSCQDWDLTGKPPRLAVKELLYAGYKVKIIGTGLVAQALFQGKYCTLLCQLNIRPPDIPAFADARTALSPANP